MLCLHLQFHQIFMLRLKTLQLYSWPSRRKAILLWWYFLPFLDSRAHTNLPWEELKKPPAKLDPHTQIAIPGSNLNRNYSCLTQWFGSLRALNKHTAHTTNFMKVLVAGMPFCYQLLFLSLLTSICFQEGINFSNFLFALKKSGVLISTECKSCFLSTELFSWCFGTEWLFHWTLRV